MKTIKVTKDLLTIENLKNNKELYQKIKDELIVNSKDIFMKHYNLTEKEYQEIVNFYNNEKLNQEESIELN